MILSDPARYVDRCWIRNFNTIIGRFISNITIVEIHKLPKNIYWNMVCLVSTVCILSMTLITHTYLLNMACPNRVVSWTNTVCVHWTGHGALVSELIMTSPHLPLWRHEYISSVWRSLFSHDHVISNPNFPVNDLCHDSIGNKLFGFVFSRSDEPIVIGVCGMRADRFWNRAQNWFVFGYKRQSRMTIDSNDTIRMSRLMISLSQVPTLTPPCRYHLIS